MESFEQPINQESSPDREKAKKAFAERLDREGWMITPTGEDYCGECWEKHPYTSTVVPPRPVSEFLEYRDNGDHFSVHCMRGDCTNKDNLLFSEEFEFKKI